MEFSQQQLSIIESPITSKFFLSGPAGTGKTTVGVERMRFLTENDIPANQVLVMMPQRTLAGPYLEALSNPAYPSGGIPSISTIGGLAHRYVELFWPTISKKAGFLDPEKPPTFLTLESSQYYLASIIRPLLDDKGYFSSVTIQRHRLYSQILDNLNKAAIHGFPHTEIAERLSSSWIGDPGQLSIFEDAQECALLFRRFCLDHSLLDFSLQIEIFWNHLWPMDFMRDYFFSNTRHLIFDNLEEDIPVCHQFLADVIPSLESVLLIFDQGGGYRKFLGADPISGKKLQEICTNQVSFQSSFVTPYRLASFESMLNMAIFGKRIVKPTLNQTEQPESFDIRYHRYYPEMISWVGEEISRLVDRGINLDEIVILAPFMSDSLRFLIENELAQRDIPAYSHRPSRALRDEPASRCLLTLAATVYPTWELRPTSYQLTYALLQAIADLDLTRANLLVQEGIIQANEILSWKNFDQLPGLMQRRITYSIGTRYQNLVTWLQEAAEQPPIALDYFFRRIFGEILSQPGFGFHKQYAQAQTASNLIESAKNFRLSLTETSGYSDIEIGKEYYLMVQEGIISAQYLSAWQQRPENAVFLAPSYTFLVNNYPVKYQFWLDAGSPGWYERIYQPLTHPYVLNSTWEIGRTWTDTDELEYSRESLSRLTTGLIRRCSDKVYLCLTEIDEQGYEQKGLLVQALNQLQRSLLDS